MASAQGIINGSGSAIPQGLAPTTTPQGGTAYTDTSGTYGVAGSIYVPQANQDGTTSYVLKTALPGVSAQPTPTPSVTGTGVAPLTSAANPGMVPVGTPGTTVATAANPSPSTTPPAPIMPPAVKTALTMNANAEGSALGNPTPTRSSSTGTTAPTIDYTLHPGETIDQYNARITAETAAANGGTAPDTTDDTGASSAPNINDFIGSLGAPPAVPDSNAEEAAAQQQVGLAGLQSTLATLTTQYNTLSTQIQTNQAGEASKPGVIASIVNGRMTMLSAEDSAALANLKSQVTAATTAVTQANTAVTTIMKNDQTDYTNASAAYDKAYSAAITQYNDAVTQQDKQQADAKANAQVIINSYKGSSVGVNSITPEEEAQWTALELAAGLPPGTILAAVTAELTITKFSKGSDGNTYVTGTDANGNPYVAQVEGSQGSGTGAQTTGGWTTGQLKVNSSKMSAALQAAAGSDGFVSNGTWRQAETDWIHAKGTAATFETQFKSFKSTNASAGNS